MIIEAKELIQPNKDSKLWRYMDFTKFMSLLDLECLYFARTDCLGDPFEGSITLPDSTNGMEGISEVNKLYRMYTAVSCWHMNDFESAAMWKLYLSGNEGVAILTTYNDILEQLVNVSEFRVFHALVNYLDFNKDQTIHNLFSKRRSFEHEKEFRVVLEDFDGFYYDKNSALINGYYLPVNLDKLINMIFVSPTSPRWFVDLIKSVVKKYGLETAVIQSSLLDEPIF